jgi:outer membrane receptor protein involved in Fe transport
VPTRDLEDEDETEELARGYLYWTPFDGLALSAEYQFERFDRDPQNTRIEAFVESKTHGVPLELRFFHPSGIFSGARATYVNQSGIFRNAAGDLVHGSDNFWVVDLSLGYRLPKRLGLVTVGIRNLFDARFNFQDSGRTDPGIISPKRLILGRFTLSF